MTLPPRFRVRVNTREEAAALARHLCSLGYRWRVHDKGDFPRWMPVPTSINVGFDSDEPPKTLSYGGAFKELPLLPLDYVLGHHLPLALLAW